MIFPDTSWTLILSARKGSSEQRKAVLQDLLAVYWRPLYYYVRRKGLDRHAAEDAVQGLIAQLLEKDFLAQLAPEQGRLRAFLKTAMNRFLVSEHRKGAAVKRGGGTIAVAMNFDVAESALQSTPPDPEQAYDSAWAVEVMQRALAALQREFENGERVGPFEVVKTIFAMGETPSYKETAARYGLSVPQLKSFVHRTRQRYLRLLQAEVASTVTSKEDQQMELHDIMAVLSP